MTAVSSSSSSSASPATFKLRDYAALVIFLLTLLQNVGTYWKETNKHRLASPPPLQQHQHQQYSEHQHQNDGGAATAGSDSSRRIEAQIVAVSSHHNTSSNTKTSPTGQYYDNNDEETTTPMIRRWGCNLHQTPLIYIHIGKAGGGMVRARFAASALEFGANQSWQNVGKAYYPIRVALDDDDVVGTGNGTPDAVERDGERVVYDEPHHTEEYDNGYYVYKKGYFCNSGHPNFRAHGKRSFEGTQFCHATTPLGQAVACPVPLLNGNGNNMRSSSRNTTTAPNGIINTTTTTTTKRDAVNGGACRKACHFLSDSCRVVYVGHNLLGSEMHWLPQRFLSNWWKNDFLKSHPPIISVEKEEEEQQQQKHSDERKYDDKIQAYLQTLAPGDLTWCPYDNKSRPVLATDYVQEYAQCSVALGQAVDKEAFLTVQRRWRHYRTPTTTGSSNRTRGTLALPQHPLDYIDWSHLYASMPVLRTTIIRDPFSWLVSKFFWHSSSDPDDDPDNAAQVLLKCDNVEMATMPVNPFTVDDKVAQQGGWANRYALNYIVYLCGEDCAARYHQGIGNLPQMERQAANNLRHSFAVVGLLEEMDIFYDMVTKRVQYVNMSRYPYDVIQGAGLHSSGNGPEQLRCKEKFADASFQALLKEKSPIIAALDRLYQVGVQVNRFQLEELETCPSTTTTTTFA